MLVQIIDGLLFVISFLMFINMLTFMFAIQTIFVYTACKEFKQLNTQLMSVIDDHKRKQHKNGYKFSPKFELDRYHSRHVILSFFTFNANEKLGSPLAASLIFCACMINIYLIVFLFFRNMSNVIRVNLFIFWLAQTIFTTIIVLEFILLNEEIHRSSKPLHYMLSHLNSQFPFQTCWKISIYYELLHRSIQPIMMSAGIFGNITKHNISKVS